MYVTFFLLFFFPVCPFSRLHWPTREPHSQHGPSGQGSASRDPRPVPVLHENPWDQTRPAATSLHPMSAPSRPPPSHQTGKPDLRAAPVQLLPTNHWLRALFFLFLLPPLGRKPLSLLRRLFCPMLDFDCDYDERRDPTLILWKRYFAQGLWKDRSSRTMGYSAGKEMFSFVPFFYFNNPEFRLSPKSPVFRDATVYRSGAESFTPPLEHFYQSMWKRRNFQIPIFHLQKLEACDFVQKKRKTFRPTVPCSLLKCECNRVQVVYVRACAFLIQYKSINGACACSE